MLKVYTKNGIELIDESLNTKFNDYEINFEKNFIIDSNNNLVYSINGDFVGKILQSGPIPPQYILGDRIELPPTAYIDTGIAAIPRYTRSLFTVKWIDTNNGTRGLYGVRGKTVVGTDSYNVFLVVGGTGPRWDNCGPANLSSNWSVGEEHTVDLTHADNNDPMVIVDGEIVAQAAKVMSEEEFSSIQINTFFTVSNEVRHPGAKMQWKTVKIWKDGINLSADMVPVYDKVTHTGGMYDLVRKIFLPAVGSVNIKVYDANGNIITDGQALDVSYFTMSDSADDLAMLSSDEEITVGNPEEEVTTTEPGNENEEEKI